MNQAADYISGAYKDLYKATHKMRAEMYDKALETIKGLPEWATISEDPSVSESEREAVLRPLAERAMSDFDLSEGGVVCNTCKATVAQMETDIAAIDAIRDQAMKKIQEMAAPGEKIERVRVSTIFTGKLETPEDVETAINQLKEHLLKLLSRGMKVILEEVSMAYASGSQNVK